ncbi:MAG: glycosyltransferase family 2 protein [Pyrinomonadaceae bacterium]
MKISVAIITLNEERNIADAITSVTWADEILVVDSGSADRTREIAFDMGAQVIEREWPGFAAQKRFATESAKNDWVLSIDADERVSPELRDEILDLGSTPADGYRIPRLSFYMGRAVRHGGWYPDRQLRLFDRRRGKWKPRLIHESVEMRPESTIVDLRGDLLHFSVENAAHHHAMIGERYAPLAAQQMFADGRRTSGFALASAGPAAFLRSYLLKAGFLDGLAGFAIAGFAAHHAFLKHLLLWEMQSKNGTDGE